MRRDDQPLAEGASAPQVGWRFIGWRYFETMGIPLLDGRPFDAADCSTTRAVGIVNATFARTFFGDATKAVGQRIVQYGGSTAGEHPVEIVGVAADVRHGGLDKPPVAELFRPLAQTFMFPMAFVVRTSGAPAGLAAAVRQTAFDIDPAIPVAEMQAYTTMVADTLGRPRLLGFLLSVFAGAGLALGLVGVYGVAAYRVRQHERDIGIRLALGAAPARIASRVLRQGLLQAAAGLALGIPVALGLTRAMESVIYGVTPDDPVTFVTLPVVILAVSAAATYFPARRAAQVDPLGAMRDE
ncbi:MAG: FtsX-like permease family protein [Vicinamibacterales bacterium]